MARRRAKVAGPGAGTVANVNSQLPFMARPAGWRAAYGFCAAAIAIGGLALIAHISNQPFIFPSLGPSAFLAFTSPFAPSASPRNTVFGHWIGAASGYAGLWAFGLAHHPGALKEGVSLPRIAAAAIAVALATAAMVIADAPHPPACATALLVALGLLPKFHHIVIIAVAAVVMAAFSVVINRVARVAYPTWSTPPSG